MKFRPPFMVQTSLKHQEKPSEYLIYSPLLHIITNRPPCRLVEILLPSPWMVNSSGPQCPVRHGIYTRGRGIDWTRVNMMQQCASLCQQRRACHYWTYIKSGQYTGYCATMTNVTRRMRWGDAVSGTKNCNWFHNDDTTTNYEIDVISKRENR